MNPPPASAQAALNDWMALLVSFMLVLQGVGTTIYPLDALPSIWLLPAVIVDMLSLWIVFGVTVAVLIEFAYTCGFSP